MKVWQKAKKLSTVLEKILSTGHQHSGTFSTTTHSKFCTRLQQNGLILKIAVTMPETSKCSIGNKIGFKSGNFLTLICHDRCDALLSTGGPGLAHFKKNSNMSYSWVWPTTEYHGCMDIISQVWAHYNCSMRRTSTA